ncbi:MAG: substrate-binding domain-containing protein [Victivallales bacterium]
MKKILIFSILVLIQNVLPAKMVIADTIGQEKIVRTLAMSLTLDRNVEIESAKLTEALRDLRQGKVDLVLSNYKLDSKQRVSLKVNCYRYALEPLLVVTSAANKIDNISLENLKKVLKGDILTWRPLGGEAYIINLAIVKDDQPGMLALYKEFLGKSELKAKYLPVSNARGIGVLASIKAGFLGICGFANLPLAAKPLAVNGVKPTIKNIRSGRYRPTAEYWVWISARDDFKDRSSHKSALDFLKLLRSPEAVKLIESCGLLSSVKPNLKE